MKRLQSFWMSLPKRHRDAEAARRWFARPYANTPKESDGEQVKLRMGRSFENTESTLHARRAYLCRNKRAREARRDLPNPRTGCRAWRKARLLRRCIPHLCRRARRCLHCDLRPDLQRSSRPQHRSGARTRRRPATNLRDPLRFPHLDVQE
jgi:hypothetical protein